MTTKMSRDASDGRALRAALGRFATGVGVATVLSERGEPLGLTINSFNSVSLDPPLIVWSLGRDVAVADAFIHCRHYAINLLGADQQAISEQFAAHCADRFAGVGWQPGHAGVPLLDGCLAWFECVNTVRYPGGDHVLFVSELEGFRSAALRAPLVYFGSRYRCLAEEPGPLADAG